MDTTVTPALETDRQTLENLIQFYLYEFTAFKAWDVQADGRFQDYGLEDCWTTDERLPFLIRVNEKLAGFAIVDAWSHLTDEHGIWDMTDFFVLRRYQQHGVGEEAARKLFDRFSGRWEVRQMVANFGAQAFWHKVIDRYTGGRFEVMQMDDVRWRGPVHIFSCGT